MGLAAGAIVELMGHTGHSRANEISSLRRQQTAPKRQFVNSQPGAKKNSGRRQSSPCHHHVNDRVQVSDQQTDA
jgi:hypothetical protein